MTYAEALEAAAGEPITHVAIGPYSWDGYGLDTNPNRRAPNEAFGVVLPWSEARQYLEYEYKSDWGSPQCHAVYAWCGAHVLVVRDYDGMTTIIKVPALIPPVGEECMPQFV